MKPKTDYHSVMISLAVLFCISTLAQAETQYYQSRAQQVSLIELYTSEGCSSCPVADAWLSAWENDKRLWRDVVPVAFHVDYWNYLGWKDVLAKPVYSARQRQHKKTGNVDSVYTPSLIINGGEWRGFFNPITRHKPPLESSEVGVLALTSRPPELILEFGGPPQQLNANFVFLAHNLDQPIRAGENKGRTLHHDFAVLDHIQQPTSSGNTWRIEAEIPPGTTAIAAWLSDPTTLKPVQAVGGWLATETSPSR